MKNYYISGLKTKKISLVQFLEEQDINKGFEAIFNCFNTMRKQIILEHECINIIENSLRTIFMTQKYVNISLENQEKIDLWINNIVFELENLATKNCGNDYFCDYNLDFLKNIFIDD